MNKLYTNCIVQTGDRVLLGMKKRGFAEGYWNGFGGKVNPGESVEEAASRELFEESGITPIDMKQRGVLTFTTEKNPELTEIVYVYSVENFEGDPIETEEMAPKWFHLNEVDSLTMWPDHKDWMPMFFAGKNFEGKYHFRDDNWLEERGRLLSKDIVELT